MRPSTIEFKTSYYAYSYNVEHYAISRRLELKIGSKTLFTHTVDSRASVGSLLKLLDDINSGLAPIPAPYPSLSLPSKKRTLFSGLDHWEDEEIWAEPELDGDNIIFKELTLYGGGNSTTFPEFSVPINSFRKQVLEFIAKESFFYNSMIKFQLQKIRSGEPLPKEFLQTTFKKTSDEFIAEMKERLKEAGLENTRLWEVVKNREGDPGILTWALDKWPDEPETKISIGAKEITL